MKLVWRSAAMSDREKIMRYIAQDKLSAALKLNQEFKEKAELARTNPTMYRAGRIRGTREIVVHNNYVIVYKVDEKAKVITMLRVLHAAQQFPKRSEVL